MIRLLRHLVGWLIGAFRSREDLILENLALRQQLLALHGKRPRPRPSSLDQRFWVALLKVVVWLEKVTHPRDPRNGGAPEFATARRALSLS